MDGQSGSGGVCSRTQRTETDGKKKKKKNIPDRVTLKKEIGLLSACTIIIGEEGERELLMFYSRTFHVKSVCFTLKSQTRLLQS